MQLWLKTHIIFHYIFDIDEKLPKDIKEKQHLSLKSALKAGLGMHSFAHSLFRSLIFRSF